MVFLATKYFSFKTGQHKVLLDCVIEKTEYDFSISFMVGDGNLKNSKHGHINDIAKTHEMNQIEYLSTVIKIFLM